MSFSPFTISECKYTSFSCDTKIYLAFFYVYRGDFQADRDFPAVLFSNAKILAPCAIAAFSVSLKHKRREKKHWLPLPFTLSQTVSTPSRQATPSPGRSSFAPPSRSARDPQDASAR